MGAVYYVGDAISVMGKLPENSVDLVLSSPPFLALRSYLPADHALKSLEGGSQATPGAYIDWLTDVVEACARILAPHGSLCFELGDTYAGGGGWGDYPDLKNAKRTEFDNVRGGKRGWDGWPLAKSLSLIPELFRLTLVYGQNPLTGRTTERWRLRNVIRWVRPNPPVGALGDKFRPATSELMVFCKSAKRFFDLDAVREPFSDKTNQSAVLATAGSVAKAQQGGMPRFGPQINTHAGAPPLDWWNIPPGGYQGAHYAVWPPELCVKPIKAMSPERVCRVCGEPSRRISEVSYERNGSGTVGVRRDLKEPDGRTNGTGMTRGPSMSKVVDTLGFTDCGCLEIYDEPANRATSQREGAQLKTSAGLSGETLTQPQQPSSRWRPGLVLDPFVGSGTTLAVATGHGRDAIGIDLDERNYQLALERVGPFLLELAEI